MQSTLVLGSLIVAVMVGCSTLGTTPESNAPARPQPTPDLRLEEYRDTFSDRAKDFGLHCYGPKDAGNVNSFEDAIAEAYFAESAYSPDEVRFSTSRHEISVGDSDERRITAQVRVERKKPWPLIERMVATGVIDLKNCEAKVLYLELE